ncbi:MAG: prolipoprotein diacylglyceryl transferase [Lachnospiraceae bacterium]|nr:prolipoprotein diacylglyceryl transferase [Lachnospiraceae bacterium]MDE6254508.1 prolipoprotein diacylglyceryl transferase [Lachnospiraceae bacterium]
MLNTVNIRFPNLGINISNLIKSFKIMRMEISMNAVVVTIAIIAGILIVIHEAKRTWQDVDTYINFSVCAVLTGLIGARLYYVIFNWNYYKGNLLQIFNIRNGGFNIYGGIIAAIITGIVFSGIKKISFWRIADTACIGLVLAQAVGKWGCFFNREAFGAYTDTLFAMQIKYDEVGGVINQEILNHLVRYDGMVYIQVHPIFLYESLWCLMLFVLIMVFRRFKKFDGEVLLWYIAGYSMGRVWIDIMRTDKWILPGLNLPISQLLAALITIIAVCIFAVKHIIAEKSLKN